MHTASFYCLTKYVLCGSAISVASLSVEQKIDSTTLMYTKQARISLRENQSRVPQNVCLLSITAANKPGKRKNSGIGSQLQNF
jgi:hypothetical protein